MPRARSDPLTPGSLHVWMRTLGALPLPWGRYILPRYLPRYLTILPSSLSCSNFRCLASMYLGTVQGSVISIYHQCSVRSGLSMPAIRTLYKPRYTIPNSRPMQASSKADQCGQQLHATLLSCIGDLGNFKARKQASMMLLPSISLKSRCPP